MSNRSSKKNKAASNRRLSAGAKAAVAAFLLLLAPLVLINGVVSAAGQTTVFPLAPRHLGDKWSAVRAYVRHLPKCLIEGHQSDLSDLIRAAEAKHILPQGLLGALVQVESGGKVHRISPTGAMGPGQLMPDTARMMKVSDPFDPAEAIDGSARYLARQIARFHDLGLALAAYNAGPGNVRGSRIPVNGETEHYVAKVLREFERRKDSAVPPASFRTFSDPGAASARPSSGARPRARPPQTAASSQAAPSAPPPAEQINPPVSAAPAAKTAKDPPARPTAAVQTVPAAQKNAPAAGAASAAPPSSPQSTGQAGGKPPKK